MVSVSFPLDPLLNFLPALHCRPWRDDVSGLPKALEPVFPEIKLLEDANGDDDIGKRMKPEGAEDPLVRTEPELSFPTENNAEN